MMLDGMPKPAVSSSDIRERFRLPGTVVMKGVPYTEDNDEGTISRDEVEVSPQGRDLVITSNSIPTAHSIEITIEPQDLIEFCMRAIELATSRLRPGHMVSVWSDEMGGWQWQWKCHDCSASDSGFQNEETARERAREHREATCH